MEGGRLQQLIPYWIKILPYWFDLETFVILETGHWGEVVLTGGSTVYHSLWKAVS